MQPFLCECVVFHHFTLQQHNLAACLRGGWVRKSSEQGSDPLFIVVYECVERGAGGLGSFSIIMTFTLFYEYCSINNSVYKPILFVNPTIPIAFFIFQRFRLAFPRKGLSLDICQQLVVFFYFSSVSSQSMIVNANRLQVHALAYNLFNWFRRLVLSLLLYPAFS